MSLSSFSRWLFVIVACLPLVVTCEAQAQTPDAKPPKVLNAAHILIAYDGATRSSATRTKEEALKIATKVAAEAKASGADFAALAKKHSDGPSGARGGDLGNFPPDRMIPAFSAATMKLKVGEISAPVESEFGYHIILRKALIEDLAAAHILIMHTESARVPPTVKRTKAEALAFAQKLAKELQAPDADFAEFAKKHSDGPSGPNGGALGKFSPNQMVKPFSDATAKLKIGQISGPVESQFGYHIILRQALPKKARAKHILVQWKGASRADTTITRTKEEAMARVKECIGKLKTGKFEDLAKEYSDGPSAPRGGDLGEFSEGQMVPAFDAALFKMKVGTVSGSVETPFGYHIIYRYQ